MFSNSARLTRSSSCVTPPVMTAWRHWRGVPSSKHLIFFYTSRAPPFVFKAPPHHYTFRDRRAWTISSVPRSFATRMPISTRPPSRKLNYCDTHGDILRSSSVCLAANRLGESAPHMVTTAIVIFDVECALKVPRRVFRACCRLGRSLPNISSARFLRWLLYPASLHHLRSAYSRFMSSGQLRSPWSSASRRQLRV